MNHSLNRQSSLRWSVHSEFIGEHPGVVTRIGTELASAMSTVADPHMGHGEAVAYLLDECCNVVLSGCMHSGRLFVEDRF